METVGASFNVASIREEADRADDNFILVDSDSGHNAEDRLTEPGTPMSAPKCESCERSEFRGSGGSG